MYFSLSTMCWAHIRTDRHYLIPYNFMVYRYLKVDIQGCILTQRNWDLPMCFPSLCLMHNHNLVGRYFASLWKNIFILYITFRNKNFYFDCVILYLLVEVICAILAVLRREVSLAISNSYTSHT